MVKQTQASGLAAKVGKRLVKSFEQHKDDEVKYGIGGELPSGIEGGVAQLVECKIGQYKDGNNVGECFFYAAGVVVAPADGPGGVPIVGLRTSIMEPLCDTKTVAGEDRPFDFHFDRVLQSLRRLGADPDDVGKFSVSDAAGVEAWLLATCEALKEEAPHFRFRTWSGKKQATGPYAGLDPRVNHDWGKLCEYSGDDTAELGIRDQTPERPISDPDQDAEEPAEADELDDLAASADGEDVDAAEALSVKAVEAGISKKQIAAAKDWATVASLIRSATAEEPLEGISEEEAAAEETVEEEAVEPEEQPPEKGDVYLFKPPKAKKEIECEVLRVYPAKKLCDLKSLADGKTLYKAVSWSSLSVG